MKPTRETTRGTAGASPRAWALAAVAGVLVFVGITEAICSLTAAGAEWRGPLYAGEGAALAVNLLALPFALKLAHAPVDGGKDGAFWMVWGLGFFTRLLGLGIAAFLLCWRFKGREHLALLAMMAVYVPAMLAESAWLAKRLFATDKK